MIVCLNKRLPSVLTMSQWIVTFIITYATQLFRTSWHEHANSIVKTPYTLFANEHIHKCDLIELMKRLKMVIFQIEIDLKHNAQTHDILTSMFMQLKYASYKYCDGRIYSTQKQIIV